MYSEKELLDKCTSLIQDSSAFKRVKIIGITGSVGRGEKNILDEGLNDVDFFVMADSYDLKRKLELEKKLKDLTKAPFTDILFLRTAKIIKQLKRRFIEQYLYDLIKGYLILCAKNEIPNLVEKAKHKEYKVSKRSGISVLLTRLWCLTGPYRVEKFKIIPLNVNFTLYQMRKAISAIVDAILIHEDLYCSPYLELKMNGFLTSRFYKANRASMDLLLEFHKGLTSDFGRIYKKLINNYLLAMNYVIGKDFSSYLQFPMKKMLLLSIFRQNQRNYIKQMIKRYKSLKLTHYYYTNMEDKTILSSLSLSYKEIYAELMG